MNYHRHPFGTRLAFMGCLAGALIVAATEFTQTDPAQVSLIEELQNAWRQSALDAAPADVGPKRAPVYVVPLGAAPDNGIWIAAPVVPQVPAVPTKEDDARRLLRGDAVRVINPLVDLETAAFNLRDSRKKLAAERDRIVPLQNDSSYASLVDTYRRQRMTYAAARSNLDILRAALKRAWNRIGSSPWTTCLSGWSAGAICLSGGNAAR